MAKYANYTKQERTRGLIRDSFIAAQSKDYWKKVTVNEVLQAAGISRSTFYAYYNCIEDLEEDVNDEILHNMPPYFSDNLRGIREDSYPSTQKWYAYCYTNRTYLRVLLNSPLHGTFAKKLHDRMIHDVDLMMQADAMPHDYLRPLFIEHIVGAVISDVRYWLEHEKAFTIDDLCMITNLTRMGGIERYTKNIDKK